MGSSFMPHLGHVPGWLAVTSGCIGQLYAVGYDATSFIPHFGHVPGSVEVTSGCMGQAKNPESAWALP